MATGCILKQRTVKRTNYVETCYNFLTCHNNFPFHQSINSSLFLAISPNSPVLKRLHKYKAAWMNDRQLLEISFVQPQKTSHSCYHSYPVKSYNKM